MSKERLCINCKKRQVSVKDWDKGYRECKACFRKSYTPRRRRKRKTKRRENERGYLIAGRGTSNRRWRNLRTSQPRAVKEGRVYIFSLGIMSYYKIGRTCKNVQDRLKAFRPANPLIKVEYNIQCSDCIAAERTLHKLLTKLGRRIANEIFQLTEEDLNKIKFIIRSKFGAGKKPHNYPSVKGLMKLWVELDE